VTDNSGATASASATITVTNPVPARATIAGLTNSAAPAARFSRQLQHGGRCFGNVFIAGALWGRSTSAAARLTSAGSSDMFVAKYSADRRAHLVEAVGASGDDVAQSIAVDSSAAT
jgi:hypothetical protein